KSDCGQEGWWYGNDRRIGLEDGAATAESANPSARLVDGGYGGVEMDRGTVPAAFGCEVIDERAIASPDPPVLTLVPGHPLVAECEGAGAARVGCVVTLDRPRDCLPQPIVLPVCKMRLQEVGNRQIGFHGAQGLVKPIHMRNRIVVGQ